MRAIPITEDTQIYEHKATVLGFGLSAGGTGNAALELFDNIDSGIDDLTELRAVSRALAGDSKNVSFHKPVYFKNGLFANITGDNAKAVIYII